MNERPRIKTSIIKMNLNVLKYVFKFCPVYVVFALFSVATSVVLALSEVNLVAKAISLVIDNSDINLLYKSLIKYVIIIGICYIIKIFYTRFIMQRYRMIYRKKMQTFLFSKVKHIDMESYDNPEFYDKFSRALGDSTWRGMAVFNTFVDFVEAVAIAVALGTYVLLTDVILILIVLVSAIINVFAINFINKTWYKTYRATERSRRYQYYVRRTFYQQRFAAEIKTTNVGELLIDKFEDATNDIEKIYRKAEKKQLIPNMVSGISENLIQQALSYIYLAYKLFQGLAVSVFTATVNATFKFSSNFTRAISVYTYLREHSYYINDFLWITHYEPNIEKNSG